MVTLLFLYVKQKLYDIALNEPDIWRDIKRKEIGLA